MESRQHPALKPAGAEEIWDGRGGWAPSRHRSCQVWEKGTEKTGRGREKSREGAGGGIAMTKKVSVCVGRAARSNAGNFLLTRWLVPVRGLALNEIYHMCSFATELRPRCAAEIYSVPKPEGV